MLQIVGLSTFKEHFKDYGDNYVLIGGSASSIIMDEADLPFRSTKDLDIVLCVEAIRQTSSAEGNLARSSQ